MLDKMDFKTSSMIRHGAVCIMGTGSIQRGDVAVLNLDAPNKRAQMKLKIDGTAGEINKSTLTIISIIDKLIR